MRKHAKKIKPRQADCGIYLDFEGLSEKPPALAGIYVDEFRQVVLDPRLESAAQAKGLEFMALDELINELVDDCKKNGRFIIAFSIHEQNVIEENLGRDIGPYFKNALRVAERWRNKFHPDIKWKKNSLDKFLRMPGIDYEVPEHLAKGKAAYWLRAVLRGLSKKGGYANLMDSQKEKWNYLLEYNMHDVLGLRHLTTITSRELKRRKGKSV